MPVSMVRPAKERDDLEPVRQRRESCEVPGLLENLRKPCSSLVQPHRAV